MKRLLVAAIVALAATGAFASVVTAQDGDVFCGPAGDEYRCGSILVILEEDATDSIADVIERMGGNSDTDILQEFRAVRDLLDPDGVADDTSETVVYSIAVPRGQEAAMASAYAADPAVYAAGVDRETIGTVSPPDTAMPVSSVSWLVVIGSFVVIASGAVTLKSRRAAAAHQPSRQGTSTVQAASSGYRPRK
jgi:hypothetical protein